MIFPHYNTLSLYECGDDFIIIDQEHSHYFKATKFQVLVLQYFNGISDSEDIKKSLRSDFNSNISEKLISYLDSVKNNYPVEVIKKTNIDNKLSQIYICLTDKCNANCIYCFRGCNTNQDTYHFIKNELFVKLVKSIKKISNKDCEVVFTGGEPLLHPSVLDFASIIKESGYKCNLQTNGLLLNQYDPNDLLNLFDVIHVSIDSTNSQTNDYLRGREGYLETVISNLQNINEGQIVEISTTLTNINLDSLWKIKEKFPLYKFKYTPMLKIGECNDLNEISIDTDDFISYIQNNNPEAFTSTNLPKKGVTRSTCAAGSGVLSVDSMGNIYPCQTLHTKDFLCGCISDSSLEYIYHSSSKLEQFRKLSISEIENCNKCDISHICGGGCRANSYWNFETIYREDSMCKYNKAMYLHSLNHSIVKH